MGLEIAGVDMLESDRGPLVLEINSSPGLEGIEAASGVNVASRIIANVVRLHDSVKQTRNNQENHGSEKSNEGARERFDGAYQDVLKYHLRRGGSEKHSIPR